MKLYACDSVQRFCMQVAQSCGLGEWEAALFAENLVLAQMRGIPSHGVMRLRQYMLRLKKELVVAGVEPEIVRDMPSALLVDGRYGMGFTIAHKVMELCIQRAGKTGCCFAAVFNGSHFGMAGKYTIQAAEAKMIGVCMSNTMSTTVPYGGLRDIFGTNPISIATPASKYPPVVLDMATCAIAKGKVILAAKEGRKVPRDVGLDATGSPTDDPNAILNDGHFLPFGGYKGSGISFFVDLLSTALSGACNSLMSVDFWAPEGKQDIGYFMGAFNIASFSSYEDYLKRVDVIIDAAKSCPPAPGFDCVYVPGEIEQNNYDRAALEGVEISDVVVKDLIAVGKEHGIEWPFK